MTDFRLAQWRGISTIPNKDIYGGVMSKHIPAFEKFIQDLRAAWKELPDTEARMKHGRKLLEELVKDESLRQASKSWPSTEGRKNLLFHEDDECGFAINGVVRMPGRKGSIHDHAHAWTAYGVLDGSESLERFRRVDDRSKAAYAKLELESVTEGNAGKVDLVPPFDIHAEQGGPTRSVAVILRSERVAGKVLQGSYSMEGNLYRQIEGPTNIPYEITG
jgi:predicted metal-dependent enzyme (double-stranded beta helix superfamily)